MKILVTGFEPFGGESVNPSWEAVQLLPDTMDNIEIIKLCLPTEFIRAEEVLLEAIAAHSPRAVICTGQAAGRSAISVERVAINLRDASIPDNAGFKPVDSEVFPYGNAAYFVTLPVKAMMEAVKAAGLPAELSLSAGAYVCNDVLYTLLHSGTRGGFIHLPLSPQQTAAKDPQPPCMEISDMAKGLQAAIEAAVKNK